jgi:hypothetical protein
LTQTAESVRLRGTHRGSNPNDNEAINVNEAKGSRRRGQSLRRGQSKLLTQQALAPLSVAVTNIEVTG